MKLSLLAVFGGAPTMGWLFATHHLLFDWAAVASASAGVLVSGLVIAWIARAPVPRISPEQP